MSQHEKSNRKTELLKGVYLDKILKNKVSYINRLSWSKNGNKLAIGTANATIEILDMDTGDIIGPLYGHNASILSLAWSPDSKYIISGSGDDSVCIWDVNRRCLEEKKHVGPLVNSVSYSCDGSMVAVQTADGTIIIFDNNLNNEIYRTRGLSGASNSIEWNPYRNVLALGASENSLGLIFIGKSNETITLNGHAGIITSVAWSPSGKILATGSNDNKILIWDLSNNEVAVVLESHKSAVYSLSFSDEGDFLVSRSIDNDYFMWRCDTWEKSTLYLNHDYINPYLTNAVFNPKRQLVVANGERDSEILILSYHAEELYESIPDVPTVHYTNAKVVLMGEHSTGKTCLARALQGLQFEPQESTHGMKVWEYRTEKVPRKTGGFLVREILLWDLAGQVDYQIIHQLFLDKTALGLICFDPADPNDPFKGIQYWDGALKKVAGDDCKKVMVAGRIDRGGIAATREDVEYFKNKYGFSSYIATSAKTSEGIKELEEEIRNRIPWEKLPITSSPELWKDIREYLQERRSGQDVITRYSDLFSALKLRYKAKEYNESDFDAVLSHAQTQGLVWKLSFGEFILLKPELLNDYSSAIVRVARRDPEGLGCVSEREILEARIDFCDMDRLGSLETERSLLHAVVELFIERQLALREGEYLVFPSKFNRKSPEYPDVSRRKIVYRFKGQIEDIYTTLVVRVSYSRAFEIKDLWKNAAEFRSTSGFIFGFFVETNEEGNGTISVFFDDEASEDSKVLFVRFVNEHINKRALLGSITRERIYRCLECNEEVVDKKAINMRIEQGKEAVPCLYCDSDIALIDFMERNFSDNHFLERVAEMEKEISKKTKHEVSVTKIKAKNDIGEFDVFLAHNSVDKVEVVQISEELKRRGLNPWIDKEQIPPGRWFQDVIQQAIPNVKSAAIFIGPSGLGRWESLELRAFISQCVEREIPVIPALLPGVQAFPTDQPFLKELNGVTFKESVHDTEALDRLEWGITGVKPT